MNSNAFHNVATWVMVASAAIPAFLIATGCTSTGTQLECSQSWLDPTYVAIMLTLIAAVGAVKTVVNIQRDGPGGLFKPQPPVADEVKTIVASLNKDEKLEVTKSAAAK